MNFLGNILKILLFKLFLKATPVSSCQLLIFKTVLCNISLNNVTSLGDGQQTVRMQVCLGKTSSSPLHDPLSSCEARGSASLGHILASFAYHTKAKFFFQSWVQQYICNNLVWWMGAKKRTQTISHWVILFKSFQQLCFLMFKGGIFWGSVCADGGVCSF